jgi:hypothetical protein
MGIADFRWDFALLRVFFVVVPTVVLLLDTYLSADSGGLLFSGEVFSWPVRISVGALTVSAPNLYI